MELTTWFPGYPQNVSQIRRLLRQLATQSSFPPDVTDDLVLAGSEAAGYLVSRSGVRELKLKWTGLKDGAEVELEVDGLFPKPRVSQPLDTFRLLDAVTNEVKVVESVTGRPRTTLRLVKRVHGAPHVRVA